MTTEKDTLILNQEFEQIINDIQPFYTKLTDEQLKTRISLWIRKLHERVTDSNLIKNRNLYASVLLSMLRTNHVREPFLDNPPSGLLSCLPDYNPGLTESLAKTMLNDSRNYPQWLDADHTAEPGEDTRSVNSSLYSSVHLSNKFLQQTPRTDIGSMSSASLAFPNAMSQSASKRPSSRKASPSPRVRPSLQRTPRRNSIGVINGGTPRQTDGWDDLESHSTVNISSPKVLSYVNGQRNRSKTRLNIEEGTIISDDDVGGENERLHIGESTYGDHRVKLEAKHDIEIKRLLDKKNGEAEELRAYYRSKLLAIESERDKLRERLSSLGHELEETRRGKYADVEAVRSVMMEAIDAKQAECDRTIEQTLAQTTAEKNMLQKQQSLAIQQLLDDTQSRLQRVETEYGEQYATAARMVKQLEEQCLELTAENSHLSGKNGEFETKCSRLQAEVKENDQQLEVVRSKFNELQDTHYSSVKKYEEQLNELQTKSAETEDLLRQELERVADRHENEKQASESAIDELRQLLSEVRHERDREVRELEQRRFLENKALQDQFELKMAELAQQTANERAIAETKVAKLEVELGERDSELVAVVERCRLEAAKNERQIEEFRSHVEQTTLKALSESRNQFTEIDKELNRVTRDLENVTRDRDGLKSAAEQIRTEHECQIEDLVRAHAAELAIIRESALHEKDSQINETKMDCDRRVSELKSKLQQLESHVTSSESEWKTRTTRLVEQAAAETRQEQRNMWENQRVELMKAHDAELSACNDKWAVEVNQLKSQLNDRMVAENAARGLRDTEINELRVEIEQLKEVKHREAIEAERRWTGECQRLQSELSSTQMERDVLQRDFRLAKVEFDQKIREVSWQAEARIGEMLPANVRTDLEATIEALRSQVRHHEQANESLRARLALRMGVSAPGSGGSGSVISENAGGTSGLGSEHGCDTICSHN